MSAVDQAAPELPISWRKKPVVIEAMQYGPYSAPSVALHLFLDGSGARLTDEGIVIPTLEGDHLARVGDWIIKGVQGEFYPCKPDIFAATYERADLAAPSAPAEVEGLVGELLTGWAKLIEDTQQEMAADGEDAEHTEERPDLWDYNVFVDLQTAQATHTALTALQAENERLLAILKENNIAYY